MTARERVARAWHEGSDHAAVTPFGGPLCNCDQVAERMLPILQDAWDRGTEHPAINGWSMRCVASTTQTRTWRTVMSISDRLDEIESHGVWWHSDPVAEGHKGQLLAALRAVLAECEDREEVPEDSGSGADAARVIRRMIAAALGEAGQ